MREKERERVNHWVNCTWHYPIATLHWTQPFFLLERESQMTQPTRVTWVDCRLSCFFIFIPSFPFLLRVIAEVAPVDVEPVSYIHTLSHTNSYFALPTESKSDYTTWLNPWRVFWHFFVSYIPTLRFSLSLSPLAYLLRWFKLQGELTSNSPLCPMSSMSFCSPHSQKKANCETGKNVDRWLHWLDFTVCAFAPLLLA